MKKRFLIFSVLMVFMLSGINLYGQDDDDTLYENDFSHILPCGNTFEEIDADELNRLAPSSCSDVLNQGYGPNCENNDASIPALPSPACGKFRVPIAFRQIAEDDCSGLLSDIDQRLDDEICYLNELFDPLNIEFFECPRPDPICSSDFFDFDATAPDNDDMEIRNENIPGVINIYIANTIISTSGNPAGGYAPLGGNSSNPRMLVGMNQIGSYPAGASACGVTACSGTGHMYPTLAHEMGHFFGLRHTFSNNDLGDDLADNSVCCTESDFTCDTDPDPREITGSGGGTGCNGAPSCTYNGSANDANGAMYPSYMIDNIMSYWSFSCATAFSDFQLRRMYDALLFCNTYLCCTDPTAYLTDMNQQSQSICLNETPPVINGLSNRCFDWYDGPDATATLIASAATDLTAAQVAMVVDNTMPGTYTIYMQDANSYQDPPCRVPIEIEVTAEPGDGTEIGQDNMVELCGNDMVSLTTDATVLGDIQLVGWWITETNPISTSVTDQTSLNTAVSGANIGGTLSNPANTIYASTSGNPTLNYDLGFNCDALDNTKTYYATPMLANSQPAFTEQSCALTITDAQANHYTFNSGAGTGYSTGVQDFSTNAMPPCPINHPGEPTWEINVTINNYTDSNGVPNGSLVVRIRDGSCGSGATQPYSITHNVMAGTMITITQNDVGPYDPITGSPCIVLLDFGGGTSIIDADVEIVQTYPAVSAINFPSPEYNDCLFGTPVQIICNCPACPAVTERDGNMSACTVGSLITDWKTVVEAIDGTGAANTSPDGAIYEDIIYSSTPPTNIASTNPPATEPSYTWDETAAGGPCNNLVQTVYAYVRCDLDDNGFASPLGMDDSYVLAGTYTLTLYPPAQEPTIVRDDDVCNYSIMFECAGDSEGSTTVDGSTEAVGYAGNTMESVEVMTTNGCTQMFMVNKPACTACPSINTVMSGESLICDGDATTDYDAWKASILTANPLDAAQDPNGWGTIEYSSSAAINGTTPPNGLEPDGNHSGISDCAGEIYLMNAYLTCDMGTTDPADDTYTLISTFQQSIYPYPPALTQDLTNACSLEVMDNCVNTTTASIVIEYSTDGGMTWITGTSVPGPTNNGDSADFRAYITNSNGDTPDNDSDGNPDCITTLSISAACFGFNAYDPCVCNNDQTANGAGDGTFLETVVVTGEAGVDLCVGPNSSGILSTVDNSDITATMPAFIENPAGTYTLTFHHLDAVGYTLELYDCTNNEVINAADLNGTNVTMISNNCYYPIIQFAPTTSLCASDPAIDLTATLTNDMPDGATSFNGTFAYTGTGGVTGTQFDPSVGSGTYMVTATYTPANAVGTNTDPNDTVCETSVEVTITVSSPDASFDCPTMPVPRCDGTVALNPTITGGTWSGDAAPFVTNDELDPSTMNAGTYTLIYTITDANNCTDSVTCTFQVTYDCAADGGRFDEE